MEAAEMSKVRSLNRVQDGVGFLAVILMVVILAVTYNSQYVFYNVDFAFADTWINLDFAERLRQGLTPHKDFASPLGSLYGHVLLWATQWFGFSMASVLVKSRLLVALVALVPAWLCMQGRVSRMALWLIMLLMVLTLLSPRDLNGLNWSLFFPRVSHMAIYNRMGFGLLIPLAVFAFGPLLQGNRLLRLLSGIAAGLLLAGLFFVKITFFMVGLAFVLAGALLIPDRRFTSFVALMTSFILMGLTHALHGVDMGLYLQDLKQVAQVNSQNGPLGLTKDKILEVLPHVVTFTAWAAAVVFFNHGCPINQLKTLWVDYRQWFIATLIILTLGCYALLNTYDTAEATLFLVPVVLAFEASKVQLQPNKAGQAVGLAIVLALLGSWFAHDVSATVANYWYAQKNKMQVIPAYQNSVFADVRFSQNFYAHILQPNQLDQYPTALQMRMLAEGADILRQYPGQQHLVLGYSDPYSAMMHRKAPQNTLLWWHYGRTFNNRFKPDAARLLADKAVVLVTKDSTQLEVGQAYTATIDRQFNLAKKANYWSVYVRKSSASIKPVLN